MTAATVSFVRQDSEDLQRLESLLTAKNRRCNMMMVKSAEQAESILRRESAAGAPDVVLVWGGLSDSRAGGLLKLIKADAGLCRDSLVILADGASSAQAAKDAGAPEGAPPFAEIERRTANDSFWWVVVRFA